MKAAPCGHFCHFRPSKVTASAGVITRIAPSLAGLLGMALVAALHALVLPETYHTAFALWGVQSFHYLFLDLDGPLAARDCVRLGFDVYVFNPCDVIDRVHNYSPLWLAFPDLPPHQDDRLPLGLAFDMAFFAGLAMLPPARTRSELGLRVAAVLSTAVAYATERANVDVPIFLIVLTMLAALRGRFTLRMAGYALALLAAGLKYYPAPLLLLALRERTLRLLVIFIAAAAAGVAFLLAYGHDVRRSLPNIPGGLGFADMFGAADLRFDAAIVLKAAGASVGMRAVLPSLMLAAAFAVALAAVMRLWRRGDWAAAIARLEEGQRNALVAGALLSLGCFMAGQNLDYRFIFLLLALPGLSALGGDVSLGRLWAVRHATALGVLLLWEQGIRYDTEALATALGWSKATQAGLMLPLWAAREAAFWTLMTVLATILVASFTRTPAWATVRHLALRVRGGAPETARQTASN